MSTLTPFRIPVADLLRRPGTSRTEHVEAPLAALAGPGAEIDPDRPITVDVNLERVPDGIVVRGTIVADFRASCSRCLAPVTGTAKLQVNELFEPAPLEGETYKLDDDVIDLEPLVRDTLLLELPIVPLCRTECAGLCPNCGVDRNVTTCDCTSEELDPRWAALRSLDLSSAPSNDI